MKDLRKDSDRVRGTDHKGFESGVKASAEHLKSKSSDSERLGEKIEKKRDDLEYKTGDAMERAGEKLGRAGEKMDNKLGDAIKGAGEKLEEGGDKLEHRKDSRKDSRWGS